MTEILKQWTSNGLCCKVWLEREGVYRGCVFAGSQPVRTVEFSQRHYSAGNALEQTVESLDSLAALEARPRTPFNITNVPFVDLALKIEAPAGVPETFRLTKPVKLAEDLWVNPRDWDMARLVMRACDPAATQDGLRIDLRAPLYTFVRTNPPRKPVHTWDPDRRLRMALALSRMIRPTSIGTEYSGRIIGDLRGRYEFVPGAIRGDGTRAWTSEPERDWLTEEDLHALAALIHSWDAAPLEPKSRLAQAFWYYAYAAQTELVDIRWSFIATGLETLFSSGSDQATRDFTKRVAGVASRLRITQVGPKEASRMWALRSQLVHGAKHGGLKEKDFAIYGLMERVLRELLRTAIEDLQFRAMFESVRSVQEAFPVSPREARKFPCPECGHVIETK